MICKEKHPTGLYGFKPQKEGAKQDSGNGGNKQITRTCTGVQSLNCASTEFRSDVISMCVVPVQICPQNPIRFLTHIQCWTIAVKAHL